MLGRRRAAVDLHHDRELVGGPLRTTFDRCLVVIVALVVAVAGLGGCGSGYYTVTVNAAQARVDQARELGAESVAPYEYYYAREHLRQARIEAADASYSDASAYAATAEMYAQKAIDLVRASAPADVK